MTFEQMLAQAKQLYNGTQELQRVYNGETMVWNRYNWDKYNCVTTTEEKTVWTDILDGTYYWFFDASTATNTSSEITCKFIFWDSEEGCWKPSLQYSSSIYPTLADVAAAGNTVVYRFASSTPRSYVRIYLNDVSGGKYKSEFYTSVSSTQTTTTYSKGSTYYGVVPSVKGQYPSNGRASDGYWYVAKGAVYFGGS